jgi:small subunit ribosomal protein S6
MLVLRPDAPDDRIQAVLERTTRAIVSSGGQILKAAPWGRRRLAYSIDRYREGSYHIILFEAPPESIVDLERSLLITEEILRHLVTRAERPIRVRGRDESDEDVPDLVPAIPDEDEDDEMLGEQIDESESEAAPAATD